MLDHSYHSYRFKLPRFQYKILSAVLAMLAVVLIAVGAPSMDVSAAGEITQQAGTIQVVVNPDEPNIEGARFHLYKVADIQQAPDQSIQLVMTDAFKSVDASKIPLTDPTEAATAKQLTDLAGQLQGIVEKQHVAEAGTQVMTNRSLSFGSVPVGLYLICGDEASDTKQTITYQPIIVSIPQGGTAADAGPWQYDVTSHVKAIATPKPEKPGKPENPGKPHQPKNPKSPKSPSAGPKTGDTGRVALWTGIICVAAAAIIALLAVKRSRKQNR